MSRALLGDIGATNARFALYGADRRASQVRVLPVDQFVTLREAIVHYLEAEKIDYPLQASADAARYDWRVIQLTVVTRVADTYFQIVGLQDRLKVAEQNLANGEGILRGVEAQFRAGTATQLDVVQQQTVVSNLQAAIPPLQQQLAQNVDALAILLGKRGT